MTTDSTDTAPFVQMAPDVAALVRAMAERDGRTDAEVVAAAVRQLAMLYPDIRAELVATAPSAMDRSGLVCVFDATRDAAAAEMRLTNKRPLESDEDILAEAVRLTRTAPSSSAAEAPRVARRGGR